MRHGILLVLATLAASGTLATAQQTPAVTASAAAAPTATAAAPATTSQSAPAFHTHFDGGDPISDYFKAMALRFGVAIVQPGPIKAFIVKPFDLPSKLEEAIALGQAALAPQGLTLRQTVSDNIIVLSVMTTEQARQADLQESPVSSGLELEKIDISRPDRIVTHLLPVSHPETAAALQRIAVQTKDVKADIAGTPETGITLILTGPAKGVQEAATNILKIDTPDTTKTVARTLQLHNINAEELATSLNATFVHQEGSLKAVADRRTNSIVITGPEDKVLDAMVQDIGMEASHRRGTPLPPPSAAPQPASQPGQ